MVCQKGLFIGELTFRQTQHLFAGLLLLGTIFLNFIVPHPRYANPDVLKQIHLPESLPDWKSRDVAGELNRQDDRYKFASCIWARVYGTRRDESLLFLILDTNNFHPPQACFQSSGFKIQTLEDMPIVLSTQKFRAKAIYAVRKETGFLVLYWTCIDKRLETDLVKGDVQQLFFNLLNKKRTGLMMRLDIPVFEDSIPQAVQLAQKFLSDLEKELDKSERGYLFGDPQADQ